MSSERITLGVAQASLFLDLDGTLAEIVSRPTDVRPVAMRTDVIERALKALNGRLAVISGRRIADVDRILEARVISVAGVHGLERRNAAGAVERAIAPAGLAAARRGVADIAQNRDGLIMEDKELSVTLHYRNAPDFGPEAIAALERLAQAHALELQRGDMVGELRPPGRNKGDALAAFMREPPFAGTLPIFVGDDLTDEDGFAAAAALGGLGVLVGPPRPTKARWRLDGPGAVLGWIETGVERGAFEAETEHA